MRSAKDMTTPDASHYVNEYILKDKPFNLEKIMCNAGTAVPVVLLAIEPKRKRKHTEPCKYKKNKKIESNCIIEPNQYAHIYIFSENKKAFIQHYIIIFVERKGFKKFDSLFEISKILKNTVHLLKLENKRPYFCIYFCGGYGKHTAIDVSMDYVCAKINKDMKKYFSYGKEEKNVCKSEGVREQAKTFVVSSKEHNVNPFDFRVG